MTGGVINVLLHFNGSQIGGKAKFDEIYETTDSDTHSNNLLTFPTHFFNIYELTITQWLYLRNLGITFPAKNFKKLKIYSLLEHFSFFKVIFHAVIVN